MERWRHPFVHLKTSLPIFAVWLRKDSVQLSAWLIFVATVISCTGWTQRLDYLLFDSGQHLRHRPVPVDVVIVAIDQYSLDRIGRWPWPRDVHTQLLSTLCSERAHAIGFDIAFVEPSTKVDSDQRFADAIHKCANVVLPLLIETSSAGEVPIETPPIPLLRSAVAGLGRVGVRLDEDGIARSVDLFEGIGQPRWPLFAQELLRVASRKELVGPHSQTLEPMPQTGPLVGQGTRRIDFIGPAGSVQQVSYSQVLNGRYPPGYFYGKTILVGTTAVGLGDFLSTPTSGLAQPLPGVEVQANILLGLRDGRLIEAAAPWLVPIISALLALIPMLWLPRLMPLAAMLATVVWVVLLGVTFAALPVYFQYWIAPSGAVIAALCSFPLWSWKRLESARRHLDQELLQLRSSLAADFRDAPPSGKRRLIGFEQRIAWVQDAQRTLKRHEEQRRDTLAFISHDLRVPLSSAIQVLEHDNSPKANQLLPSLRRALRMAQDFVVLARAEALVQRDMQELDLLAILHQAADELYTLSQQMGVRIERNLPDDAVWIQGDFDSLERATINLLHNAVTHAPRGTDIRLSFEQQGHVVSYFVENDGAPLPAHQVSRLFQRFSRVEETGVARSSTGLGLYFVRTVIEKHGGQVVVEFVPGKVRFRVNLPVNPDYPKAAL